MIPRRFYNMSENCTHDCSSCGQNCSRQTDLSAKLNAHSMAATHSLSAEFFGEVRRAPPFLSAPLIQNPPSLSSSV